MNFSFFIAKRYFFSKNTQNIINLISLISIISVAVGTMSLIVILSVFNGFDILIKSLFNKFNPDLKITSVVGKTFFINNEYFEEIKNLEDVIYFSENIEENALLKFRKKQHIAKIKAVDENFLKMNNFENNIYDGEFILKEKNINYAIVGRGLAYNLQMSIGLIDPIHIYSPRRTKKVSTNINKVLNHKMIHPSGIFSIQLDFDSQYIIIPINFARELFNYKKNEVNSVELKLNENCNKNVVQEKIKKILGENFSIKNHYEQNELLFKTMKSEKWIIFLILTFILTVSSFNIIASISMLIIDKKDDIIILRNLGANRKIVERIFLLEGFLISITGIFFGLLFGAFLSFLQEKFHLIPLGDGVFIIDYYPVNMQFIDFLYVFIIVFFINLFASWYPSKFLIKRYFH